MHLPKVTQLDLNPEQTPELVFAIKSVPDLLAPMLPPYPPLSPFRQGDKVDY